MPPSALLRAGLRVELDAPDNLLAAARWLTAAATRRRSPPGVSTSATVACHRSPERSDRGGHGGDRLVVARRRALGRRAPSGGDVAPTPLGGARRVTILAGAAGSMSAPAGRALEPMLDRALAGHAGVLLAGGTAVGVPGIVGRVARRHGVTLIGYVPEGGDGELYPDCARRRCPRVQRAGAAGDVDRHRRAGLAPGQVRLLACPGGSITLQEMLLARASGRASGGWIRPRRGRSRKLPFGPAACSSFPSTR